MAVMVLLIIEIASSDNSDSIIEIGPSENLDDTKWNTNLCILCEIIEYGKFGYSIGEAVGF